MTIVDTKGDWNMRYYEKSPSRQAEIDRFSMEMFGESFTSLDSGDQERVVRAMGSSAMAFKAEEKSIASSFEVELKDGKVVSTRGVIIDTQPDLYNDVCTKECLKDMVAQIKERAFTMDLEHDSFRGEPKTKALNVARIPISRITEAGYRESGDGHGQVIIKDLLNTAHGRYDEVAGSISGGYLHSYSIAFVPVKVAYKSIGGVVHRFLGKVNLLNVTYTGVPVNPRAVMEGVVMKAKDGSSVDLGKFINGEGLDFKDFDALKIEAKAKMGEQGMSGKIDSDVSLKDLAAGLASLKDEIVSLKAKVEAKADEEEDEEEKKKKAAEEAETKSDSEKKEEDEEKEKEDAETKALKAQVLELKSQVEKMDKVLSAPQFKSRFSEMEASLKARAEMVDKSKGPLDRL